MLFLQKKILKERRRKRRGSGRKIKRKRKRRRRREKERERDDIKLFRWPKNSGKDVLVKGVGKEKDTMNGRSYIRQSIIFSLVMTVYD